MVEIFNVFGVYVDIYGIGSCLFSFYDSIMYFLVYVDGDVMICEVWYCDKLIFLWLNVWWNE